MYKTIPAVAVLAAAALTLGACGDANDDAAMNTADTAATMPYDNSMTTNTMVTPGATVTNPDGSTTTTNADGTTTTTNADGTTTTTNVDGSVTTDGMAVNATTDTTTTTP